MLYLIQNILFLKIFFVNCFNASNNGNKIFIFHFIVFIANVFEYSREKKKRGENPDCVMWEILSDPVIKDCHNEHMQRKN